MLNRNKIIKVLLAQFPLETHSRGMITVAGMLRDADMEVIIGGNALPEETADKAVREEVDVIGISTYCGGELALSADLFRALKIRGIKDKTICLLGGVFPSEDVPELMKMGFSKTFPPSTTCQEIVTCIESALAKLPFALSRNAG
jgi:methylmalonyl-CoA mutase, C-terminal domain